MRYRLLLSLVTAAVLACCAARANATTYALTATFVDDSTWQASYPSAFAVDSLTVAPSGAPSGITAFSAELAWANTAQAPRAAGWTVDISREVWQNTQHTWLASRNPWQNNPAVCNLADVPAGYSIGGVKAADLQTLFTAMPQGDNVTPSQAAAFGAAVSQVVDEISEASGANINSENSLLAGATFQDTQSVFGMYSIDTQNITFFVPNTADSAVPEPITFLSGLIVVSSLGYYVRRRTRLASAKQ
jgi:hypothetical protein